MSSAAPSRDGYVIVAGARERGRLAALWRFRGLLWSFTLREVQVRYRQAVLGFAWALLQPVALAVVTTLVFHHVLGVTVSGLPYALFAYTGLVAFTFFQTAVSGAVPTLVNNAGLVRKIWFPREALPLAAVFAVGLDLLAGLVLWFGLLAVYDRSLPPTLPWVLVPLLILWTFALACALAGAAVNVRFRDVKHALPLAMQLLFFASPIVYSLEIVPSGWRNLLALNPLVCVVEGMRDAVLFGRAPDLERTLIGAAVALVALVLSWQLFTRAERRFADIV